MASTSCQDLTDIHDTSFGHFAFEMIEKAVGRGGVLPAIFLSLHPQSLTSLSYNRATSPGSKHSKSIQRLIAEHLQLQVLQHHLGNNRRQVHSQVGMHLTIPTEPRAPTSPWSMH